MRTPFSLSSAAHSLRWTLPALCGLLLFAGRAAHADINIKLDLKEGDKISDVTKIVAQVNSADGIDKVEFKVDEKEPFVDTSVPYEYEWDTIKDTEGAHTLAITAYDTNQKTKRLTISLTIDNELGTGAVALAQKGRDALATKDYATALKYSRRSLKAEPDNVAGSRILAAVYGARGDWPKAIASLEKADKLDQNGDAMLELASYRMRRALLPENAANFFGELQEINDLRRKAGVLSVKDAIKRNTPDTGKPTPQNYAAIGDTMINAGQFHEAALEYSKAALTDEAPVSLVNRLALALVLDDRSQEALNLIKPLTIAKKDDAATHAVYGLALLRLRRFAEARTTVRADLTEQLPATLVVASYADAILGNNREAIAEGKDAVTLAPGAGEAHYAYSIGLQAARDNKSVLDSETSLSRALSLTPFHTGPYLDYATRILLQKRQDRFDQALNLTDFVLKYDPENVNAKIMQAMIYLQTKRIAEAEPVLNNLRNKAGQSPDVLMALAVYWNIKGNGSNVTQYMNAASKADQERFGQATTPTPLEYLVSLNRRYHYRVDPYLTIASLYPNKGDASP